MDKDSLNSKKLEFYGGEWMSFLPFSIFIVLIVLNTFYFGSISDGALWVPAFLGLIVAFFLARDKSYYSTVIIKGMASEEAIIPIVCWIFAGVFSKLLSASGLAGGIAGVAASLGVGKTAFIIVSFIVSALFATASGTGFGTIATGMGVLYPAGAALGAYPPLLAGAIISGAAFGDNLAPISDTTICSATSLGVDVPGVVRSRIKYALSAGILTILGIVIFSGVYSTGGLVGGEALGAYNPKTLIMLIPVIITIISAIRTGNIIIATILGTVTGSIFGLAFGLIDFIQIDQIEPVREALITISGSGLDRAVGGIFYTGINSMIQVIILALLLFASISIMRHGRGDEKLLEALEGLVKTPRGAEFAISIMVIVLSSLMGLNAPAILAVGPSFAKPLASKYGISPYRAANLLDAQSNTFVYALPWTPAIIYTLGFAGNTAYPLMAKEITPFVFYAYSMLLVMFISIVLGIGRQDNLK